MKRYDKYKPSGVDWIGDIPEGWEIKKQKFVSELYTGNSLNEKEKEKYAEIVDSSALPYIASKDIERDTDFVDYDNGMMIPKNDSIGFKIAPKNSFLLCIEGGSAGKKICYLDRNVCFVNKLCCFNTKLSKFHYYYVKSNSFGYSFSRCLQGLIGGVSVTELSNIEMPIPPLSEQIAIANFLDAKCAEIDKVVATQQRRIALLQELKQATITQAVTRGLDPNAKMKDSGVEWIGEVPEGWEVCKTLYVLAMPITDGPHTTPELFDEGIPFVSAEAVSCGNGKIDFDHIRGYVSQSFYEECCLKYIPQRDDVYLIKSGATTGKVAIVDTDRIFTIWSPLAVYRANEKILPLFLFYSIQADYYQKEICLNWNYGTQQNIGMRTLEQLKIVLPPISEQKKIVSNIEVKCAEIDKQMEAVGKQIELLREYKQALITEVVTGKRKVC